MIGPMHGALAPDRACCQASLRQAEAAHSTTSDDRFGGKTFLTTRILRWTGRPRQGRSPCARRPTAPSRENAPPIGSRRTTALVTRGLRPFRVRPAPKCRPMFSRRSKGLPISERNLRGRLALVLIGISACAKEAKRPSNDAVSDAAALAVSQQSTSDSTPRSACDRSPGHWTSVDFTDVDLGSRVHGGVGYIPGPATVAAVRSDDEWTRVWKRIADTVQTPRVSVRDSIILVLATREFTGGPVKLDIMRVRLCREDNIGVGRISAAH